MKIFALISWIWMTLFPATTSKLLVSIDIDLHISSRKVAYYEKEHEKAKKEALEYSANPINIYLLVKRLVTDWKFNETYISSDQYDG